jgi:hypothetical protein
MYTGPTNIFFPLAANMRCTVIALTPVPPRSESGMALRLRIKAPEEALFPNGLTLGKEGRETMEVPVFFHHLRPIPIEVDGWRRVRDLEVTNREFSFFVA